MEYFVFVYRPSSAWLPNRSILQQPLEGHFDYMEELQQGGVLCLGGPFKDDAGAFGIIQATDFESASAIILNDPAVRDEVVEFELHPWHPSVPGTVGAKVWT